MIGYVFICEQNDDSTQQYPLYFTFDPPEDERMEEDVAMFTALSQWDVAVPWDHGMVQSKDGLAFRAWVSSVPDELSIPYAA